MNYYIHVNKASLAWTISRNKEATLMEKVTSRYSVVQTEPPRPAPGGHLPRVHLIVFPRELGNKMDITLGASPSARGECILIYSNT